MGNLKNIDCAVPILGTQNLKHTLGLGDAESYQRSPILMLLLFFNSCTTKMCDLLYEAVVLNLFDSRNSTQNQNHFLLWAIQLLSENYWKHLHCLVTSSGSDNKLQKIYFKFTISLLNSKPPNTKEHFFFTQLILSIYSWLMIFC